MAERAADVRKALRPRSIESDPPGVVVDGVGRREEALEHRELLDRADRVQRRERLGVEDVVGHRRELAARRLVTLDLEQLVGDAHLDVVGLAREQQQRLVLRLPAEARDRAVVAVAVDLPDMVRPAT